MAEAPGIQTGVHWDRSAARTHRATVTAAASIADRIVLSFGMREGEDKPGAEQAVQLARRIALQPMTAKHLHDMLARLIAETAATSPGQR